MKHWLFILCLFLPALASSETVLPYKPTSRVSDVDNIFDPKTRDFISLKLREEYARNKIAVYVIAMDRTEKNKETATANRIRDAWIKDPVGLVILFTRNSDKISISLTDKAYKLMSAGGRLELVASKIDEFNEEGPSRGMPKVINLLLDRIRLDRKVVVVQERDLPTYLIIIPFCLLLGLVGIGLFKFYRYMEAQNVFTPLYVIKSDPVKPVLGSSVGGVNTAEAKF